MRTRATELCSWGQSAKARGQNANAMSRRPKRRMPTTCADFIVLRLRKRLHRHVLLARRALYLAFDCRRIRATALFRRQDQSLRRKILYLRQSGMKIRGQSDHNSFFFFARNKHVQTKRQRLPNTCADSIVLGVRRRLRRQEVLAGRDLAFGCRRIKRRPCSSGDQSLRSKKPG